VSGSISDERKNKRETDFEKTFGGFCTGGAGAVDLIFESSGAGEADIRWGRGCGATFESSL